MNTEQPTPRTDAARLPDGEYRGPLVWADFARTLERELAAAQAEARELLELIGLASTSFSMLEAYLGPQWFEAVHNMDLVGPDKVHARAALAKKEAQP